MEVNFAELEHVVNALSLDLVMVDPEDLISMGEVLVRVEELIEVFAGSPFKQPDTILTGIRMALEAVILDNARDKQQTLEIIGRGCAILQDIVRNVESNRDYVADLKEFLSGLKQQAGIELVDQAASGGAVVETETVPEEQPGIPLDQPEPSREEVEEAIPMPSAEMFDVEQDQDLFFGFITESQEHIESIEVNTISLEQDPQNKETINAIFRPFHTIKGVSGFLNLRLIHSLTHDVENLLDDARNDRIDITRPLIDVILDAVDILKMMIRDVKYSLETGQPLSENYSIRELTDRIKVLQQGDVPEEPEIYEADYTGKKLGEILIDQGLITTEELERILSHQEGARLRKLGEIIVDKGVITPEDLEGALKLQLEGVGKKLGEILIDTGKADPATISNAIREQEDNRDRKIGELLIRQGQAGAREVTGALREQKRGQELSGVAAGHTVKVDTIKLDNLVDMVGELVIAQSLVASNKAVNELKDQKLVRDISHMARITSELQRTAMSMRMVPIRQTFQKMIRLVRDLSRKSSKQVELTMSGEDTEIDRNMVEAIYDPLVHMIRNSVDHGVESPDTRHGRGKTLEGHIHLRSFHQGGNVVIEIEDDGQGLNPEKILAKAVERGLIGPEDNLSEHQIYNLVFQPGFSTADQVTDVSGRGVGMDVVKRAIEKMRGKIEMNSEIGKGTTVTIRLPLTLAIIDGMIVRVGGNRYILPTVAIHESFRPDKSDYHTVRGKGEMIKVRQNLLPLIRLDHILGVEASVKDPSEALVIVVENNGERRCIMVDEVLGKQEVVIKSLGERLKYVRALAGGSILGDGMVGLILDIAGVFEVSSQMGGGIITAGKPVAESDWEMSDDWGMGPT